MYEEKLAEWKKAHSNVNPNGVSAAEVNQQLVLGREPNATVSFSNNAGKEVTPVFVPGVGGDQGSHADNGFGSMNLDSESDHTFHFNGAVKGIALIATYSNLKNSYYTDDNGIKHTIAKIVRTFSDLSESSSHMQYIAAVTNNTGQWNLAGFNNGNPSLIIYSDPTDGFWYNRSDGVTVTDQYYDEAGNLINLSSNSAYLAITSLNNEASVYDQSVDTSKINNGHVERVQPLGNSTSLSLLGSSVTDHNGILYSDKNNSNDKDISSMNNHENWDFKGPNEYYGTGLISLSGSEHSYRFSLMQSPDASFDVVWATMTTIIPRTPGPTPPSAPKNSMIRYHYDEAKKEEISLLFLF